MKRLPFHPWQGICGLALGLVLLFAGTALLADLPSRDRIMLAAQERYGSRITPQINRWFEVMQTAERMSDEDKLKRINEFFNRRIDFAEDAEIWAKSDYWATPLETLGQGRGDCEDFTIAKYFTLRFLGIPNNKLRLTYVKAKIGGMHSDISQAHMILAYYPVPDAEPYILDNLINDIRPASRRPDLTPIFTFNSEGLWVGSGPSSRSAGSSTARLSRWRDVMARMRAEGFE